MALVALPLIVSAASVPQVSRAEEYDSLMMMKERVRIANELLKAVSGILDEKPAVTQPTSGQSGKMTVPSEDLSISEGSVSTADFPSFRPTGLRQDSVGEFVWLPDSMLADWNRFVALSKAGHLSDSIAAREALCHDLVCQREELPGVAINPDFVTFRGDTIPRVLKDRKFGRFDRGLFNYLYIPKGIWSFGLTASYGELSTKDVELFDVITGMTIKGNIFSISPSMQYFIKNNTALGLKFSYTRGSAGVNSLNLEIDEDMSFNINDIHYNTESYKAAATLRQYFGLDRGGRFAVFNEVELAFASGLSNFKRPYDGELRHLHATTMQAELNFSPGLHVFIMKNVGFNISFGVFGFSLKNEKQYMNDVYQGSRFTSGANFRFNIFNINFGLSVSI